MQDTFISLGRGIDGVVGRMVDQLGGTGGADRAPRAGDDVELLRYAIVSVASGRERVLHVDEALVTDGAHGPDLERRLLAPYAAHVDRDHLRVHTRVLRRWPRRPVPRQASAPAGPVAEPRAAATPVPAPPPRVEARPAPVSPPAPPRDDDLDRRLIEALAEADDGGLSMGQLVKRTGERSAELRQRLQRLAGAGTVRRAGDGLKTRYRLTDQ